MLPCFLISLPPPPGVCLPIACFAPLFIAARGSAWETLGKSRMLCQEVYHWPTLDPCSPIALSVTKRMFWPPSF